jgi:hypothetical protein
MAGVHHAPPPDHAGEVGRVELDVLRPLGGEQHQVRVQAGAGDGAGMRQLGAEPGGRVAGLRVVHPHLRPQPVQGRRDMQRG